MTKNANTPANYQTLMPYLILKNATGFISFIEKVFDARPDNVVKSDKQTIIHAELMIGECTMMLADATDAFPEKPAGFFIYVDVADETYAKALKEGATSLSPMSDQSYGRTGGVTDPFGNVWWITSVK